ncbi:MAG TPA: trehalose-phosphatase [Plantibacter sp.]|uniref:trehalose-phosphatase n=1 Tax=unclassified Plantibacter TaxID=2624265 RepID=UPI002B5B5804|nr:trehalose-phosphatase [Plantibacter sp.]
MSSDTDVIRALVSGHPTGLVMDFDGVLSRITDDPARSELLPGTERILESLAGKLSTVALLSGRPVAFLAERAAIPGVDLYGSYGLERLTAGGIDVLPEASQWKSAVRAATEELRRELDGVDGIHIEDKSLAVAIHWRRSLDHTAAEQLVGPIVERMISVHGLRREPGKCVEELRMPLDEDKGTALHRIIRSDGLRTVAYAGDDRGDLPAFTAALTASGYALVVDAPDAAEEVSRVPGAHFASPEEFQNWLQRLDDALTWNSSRRPAGMHEEHQLPV